MPPRAINDPIFIQVLSLYLLLLAFFILLNNVSSAEAARERLVVGSLNSTFAGVGRETENAAVFASKSGNFLSDPDFENRLSTLVKTDLALARFKVVEAGRVMEVKLPFNEMFEIGRDEIRSDRLAFFGRVARIITERSTGVYFDLDILIATGTPEPEEWDAVHELAIARAAAAVSRLEADGARRDILAGGIERGMPGTMRLVFHLRDEDERAAASSTGAAQ